MINDTDKLLLLRIIKTGDYTKILSFKTNLDYLKPSHTTYFLKQSPNSYKMARNIANILYEIGIIKENKLIEVGVKDLVAEYVGQTAPKTS